MNYSIATADRATHVRIVAVALFWAMAVMAIGAEPERHLRSAELGRTRAGAVAVAAAIWLISVATSPAHGQAPAEVSGGMINLGGRGWSPGEGKLVTSDRTTNQFEFDVRAGFATDYIYRGTTLSDHKPAVGAAFEAAFAQFYTGISVASVKLRHNRLPKSR